MKNRSNDYWNKRANERMASYHKNSDEIIRKITNAYDKAIKDINEDINNIFYNFIKSNELSDKEARKLLNSKIPNPIIKLMKKISSYIKNDDIKKILLSRVNAKSYKARITRLEALKESIYINTKLVADIEINESTKLYTNNIKKAYYTNIFDIQKGLGIGFNVAEMPLGTIQEILKNKWSGEHYSKRIWHNTDVLAEKLEEVVTNGLMTGKSSRKMAMELEGLTDYGKFAAERIIRTETTYISNAAEIESYKECGIDKYVFIATLDLRTSNVCREHDKKIFNVKDAEAGVNIPPLHPYCRSTTRAYFDNMESLQRRARDPGTGKTYLVPGDMNYKEWYDKFVVNKYGKDKAEVFEKMIKNKSSDRKQLEKYKEVLGKESPKTLKDFQELKYNNIDEWRLTKYNYKLRKEVLSNPNCILNNTDKFSVDERKYTSYLFGGTNEIGLAKGNALNSRLGYNIDNYKEFDILIKNNISKYPSILKGDTPHGTRYEVNMVVKGLKGKQAKLRVGVMYKNDNPDIPQLTTTFIDKLKESDLNDED